MKQTRYLESEISELCFPAHKMGFISGPRQCGKTTMAKQLLKKRGVGHYYNWDELNFRKLWARNPSGILAPAGTSEITPLIILDEIHKAKLWKKNLKGVFDTMDPAEDILVTGSARLNVYRKGSDSLLGRYYHFRLHPFSLAELYPPKQKMSPDDLITALQTQTLRPQKLAREYFELLQQFGPFPEPVLAASKKQLHLWQRGRIEKIVREDLRDLSRLPELSQIEMLVALLPERAANVLSLRSLAEDLEVAYTTVKRWLDYLRELYYCFEIKPYSKSLPRSLKKKSKLYLWDWSEIKNPAARFENMVAGHLLKYCDYLTDTGEGKFELRYLRNKEKKEIDFLIVNNNQPWLPVEVKQQEIKAAENWGAFLPHLDCKFGLQVVEQPHVHLLQKKSFGEILTISAQDFFRYLV